MTESVLFLDGQAAELLAEFEQSCKELDVDVAFVDDALDLDAFAEMLPDEPAILYLPARPAGCTGVKLLRVAQLANAPHVVAFYSDAPLDEEYVRLAFREGVADIINLHTSDEARRQQTRRLLTRFEQERRKAGEEQRARSEIDSLRAEIERLEWRDSRWRERLLALGAVASGILAGRDPRQSSTPLVMLVSGSASQERALADALKATHVGLSTLATGAEAIAEFERSFTPVVVCDGQLPDMDAATFARRLAKVATVMSPYVVVWSSQQAGLEELVEPGSGVQDVVAKSPAGGGTPLLVASILAGLRV